MVDHTALIKENRKMYSSTLRSLYQQKKNTDDPECIKTIRRLMKSYVSKIIGLNRLINLMDHAEPPTAFIRKSKHPNEYLRYKMLYVKSLQMYEIVDHADQDGVFTTLNNYYMYHEIEPTYMIT